MERRTAMLEKIKRNPVIKALYRVPGLFYLYHFFWAFFGASFYSFPSKKIFIVGVTGTKGKTTTLELLNAILEAGGKKTALLSSLRMKIGEKSEKSGFGNTMPGRFYIQRFLSQAVKSGCRYALIEVTSQGVVLHRHKFINWNAGVLTNLSPEHIESHGSFEKYRDAKLKFLRYVGSRGGKIFINSKDAEVSFFLKRLAKYKPLVFSRDGKESENIFPKLSAARSVAAPEPPALWPSDFNKDNVAAAAAVARDIGIPEKTIEEALLHFRGVPGRMEFVQLRPFAAVIDYAHTPDSLKNVYAFLRGFMTDDKMTMTKNSHQSSVISRGLICVLGAAGGGRDKWKRPEMGKIAAEYCDEIILTDEDPYDENPAEICEQISAGFSQIPNSKFQIPNSYSVILDRREAIKKAVSLARAGDTVVATGKGSEDWIHLAQGKKIPWNERAVVEEALVEARKMAK